MARVSVPVAGPWLAPAAVPVQAQWQRQPVAELATRASATPASCNRFVGQYSLLRQTRVNKATKALHVSAVKSLRSLALLCRLRAQPAGEVGSKNHKARVRADSS